MDITNHIVIKSSKNAEELLTNGFCVLPSVLNTADSARLSDFFNSTIEESHVDVDFFTTHWSPNYSYRKKVNEYVKHVCEPLLSDFFDNYKCILGYFLYKKKSPDSAIGIHQDWTLIDENKHRGFIIWIPLTDTNITNGCFHLIPGSHNKYNTIRGSHIEQHLDDNLITEMIPMPVKANDALVIDLRLVHASPPNLSSKDRLAVGLIIVPQHAQLLHYYYSKQSAATILYEAPDSFLIDSYYDYKKQLGDDHILSFMKKI